MSMSRKSITCRSGMLGQVPARPKASKLRGAEHRNGLFGGLRWRKQARIDSAQDARRDRSIAALGLIQQAPAVDSSQGKFRLAADASSSLAQLPIISDRTARPRKLERQPNRKASNGIGLRTAT